MTTTTRTRTFAWTMAIATVLQLAVVVWHAGEQKKKVEAAQEETEQAYRELRECEAALDQARTIEDVP